MIEVTVTIKRNGEAKTYQLKEATASKKGTFVIFQPSGTNPDLPDFAKLYVAAEVKKSTVKASKKS